MAKSFVRIHKANLINNGIIPLEFEEKLDYERIELNDELICINIVDGLKEKKILFKNKTKGIEFKVNVNLTEQEIKIIKASGRLNYVKLKKKLKKLEVKF